MILTNGCNFVLFVLLMIMNAYEFANSRMLR